MLHLDCKTDQDWLARARRARRVTGGCLVENVLDADFVAAPRQAMVPARAALWQDVRDDRLKPAGELGTARQAR
jgi:hypothetical protein